MARVSENSKNNILNNNLSRVKERLEGLQLKGSTLKRIRKPSEDPAGNVSLMSLRSKISNNQQFVRNINHAKSHLELTENAISGVSDILLRAKEIAIAQSSDIFSGEIRKNVAEEVEQLLHQMRNIANKKVGGKYLFSGYMTHRPPVGEGDFYQGDHGRTFVEVKRDFLVPVNLTGDEIFFNGEGAGEFSSDYNQRTPASWTFHGSRPEQEGPNLFSLLKLLRNSLRDNSVEGVREALAGLNQGASRLISLRTRVGAAYRSVTMAAEAVGEDQINAESYKSSIEDADVLSLFSELEKQKTALQAAYKSGASVINGGLLNFLRG